MRALLTRAHAQVQRTIAAKLSAKLVRLDGKQSRTARSLPVSKLSAQKDDLLRVRATHAAAVALRAALALTAPPCRAEASGAAPPQEAAARARLQAHAGGRKVGVVGRPWLCAPGRGAHALARCRLVASVLREDWLSDNSDRLVASA